MTLRTGCIHGVRPAGIQPLSQRAALHMTTVPTEWDWTKLCPADGDARTNDYLGTCVQCADFALIEIILANVAGSGSPRWKPTDDMIISRYTAETGYNPITGVPDNGTDSAADLTNWVTSGIKIPELQRDIAPWWATVDPMDDNDMAIGLGCSPLLVSLNLPEGWEEAETNPLAWMKPPGAPTNEGHRVLAVKFMGKIRTVRSWGMDLQVGEEWWQQAVVSVDAVWSTDLLNAIGTTPMGLDISALASDMASVTSSA
jgi:hypothetical protein